MTARQRRAPVELEGVPSNQRLNAYGEQALEPCVGPLLALSQPAYEEQFWQQQMGRRISLMHRWAPRTDPLLCGLLLALHATLLLRLALLGGLERLPLPLAGAYLSWLHLRMGHDWPVGWVRVRGLLLPATQLLLAASVATSAGTLAAAAAVGFNGDSSLQHASSTAVHLGASAFRGCRHHLWPLAEAAMGAIGGGYFTILAAPIVKAAKAVWQALAGSSLAALWSSGGLTMLLSECTSFWVVTLAVLPHLAGQPVAVAAWVQLAAAALNITTCTSQCSASLEGQPWLQQQYGAAAAFMQRLTAAAPVPAATVGPEGSAAQETPALTACCATKAFAWLACCCILSLRLLYRRELEGRLAWSRRQRWPAERTTQELRWALLPLWGVALECAVAVSLAWHIAALLCTTGH